MELSMLPRTQHPLYNTWKMMKDRCYRPTNKNYRIFGGRGVKVCEEWLDDFWSFAFDMGDKPEGMFLTLIDKDGDYEPSNCKWDWERNINANLRGGNVTNGVSKHKVTGKWEVYIKHAGHKYHLGVYEDKFEASRARYLAELHFRWRG